MKRLLVLLLTLLMLFSLCACGGKKNAAGGAASGGNATYKVDKVFFRTFDASDGKHFQASFRVTNTSKLPLFLYNASWELKDRSGNSITTPDIQRWTLANPQVIYPGESSWYYINALVKEMTNGSDEIADAQPQYKININTSDTLIFKRFKVSDVRLDEKDGRITATGTVENDTGTDVDIVQGSVYLYDKKGFLVGMLSWADLDFRAGEKREFTAEHSTLYNSGELGLDLSSVASFNAASYRLVQK